MKRLLLWDVDGTLIDSGDTGRILYCAIAERVLGRAVAPSIDLIHGKTDFINCHNILRDAGVGQDVISDHVTRMLSHLPTEFQSMLDRGTYPGRVLPGVVEALRRAREHGAVNTLLTGNVSAVARMKMDAMGLSEYLDLDVGGYGADAPTRNELLPVAMERVERLLHLRLSPQDIWVIGDTPHDHAVAKAGGVRSLLVASGHYPYDDLSTLHPDALLHDLCDVDEVVRTLCGDRGVI